MWRRSRRKLGTAQALLPLEEISGDVVCLRGGDYRAVLQAGSVNFALRSETEQESILAGYRRFLNGLGYPIQMLVHVVPTDVDAYLQGLRGHHTRLADEMLSRLALDHEAFVRRMARERTLLERRFYVIVPAGLNGSFDRSGLRLPIPWRKDRRGQKERDLLAASRRLAFRCAEVRDGLAAFGVPSRRVGAGELIAVWTEALGTGAGARPIAFSTGPVVARRSGKEVMAHA